MSTTYEDKVAILAELWMEYKDDEDFEDFFAYNDLGMPLAYLIDNGIVPSTDVAQKFIEETYSLLLVELEVPDGVEIEDLDDLLAAHDLVDQIRTAGVEDKGKKE